MAKDGFDWNALDRLARAAEYRAVKLTGMSNCCARHLRREFQRRFGCPTQQWLDAKRITHAKDLLAQGIPPKVVATELGFRTTAHFCRQFKAKTGMTPGEYAVSVAHRVVRVAAEFSI